MGRGLRTRDECGRGGWWTDEFGRCRCEGGGRHSWGCRDRGEREPRCGRAVRRDPLGVWGNGAKLLSVCAFRATCHWRMTRHPGSGGSASSSRVLLLACWPSWPSRARSVVGALLSRPVQPPSSRRARRRPRLLALRPVPRPRTRRRRRARPCRRRCPSRATGPTRWAQTIDPGLYRSSGTGYWERLKDAVGRPRRDHRQREDVRAGLRADQGVRRLVLDAAAWRTGCSSPEPPPAPGRRRSAATACTWSASTSTGHLPVGG